MGRHLDAVPDRVGEVPGLADGLGGGGAVDEDGVGGGSQAASGPAAHVGVGGLVIADVVDGPDEGDIQPPGRPEDRRDEAAAEPGDTTLVGPEERVGPVEVKDVGATARREEASEGGKVAGSEVDVHALVSEALGEEGLVGVRIAEVGDVEGPHGVPPRRVSVAFRIRWLAASCE
jgi:hypothetical protein